MKTAVSRTVGLKESLGQEPGFARVSGREAKIEASRPVGEAFEMGQGLGTLCGEC